MFANTDSMPTLGALEELCPDHLEVEKEKLIQELHILRARLQYKDLVTSGKSANSVPQIPNTAPIQTPPGANGQAGDGIADQVDSEMRKAGDFKLLLLEIEYVELRLEFIVKAKRLLAGLKAVAALERLELRVVVILTVGIVATVYTAAGMINLGAETRTLDQLAWLLILLLIIVILVTLPTYVTVARHIEIISTFALRGLDVLEDGATIHKWHETEPKWSALERVFWPIVLIRKRGVRGILIK